MESLRELSRWSSLLVLLLNALFLWIGWSLRKRFVGAESCAQHTQRLEQRCQELESRVVLLENGMESLPTKDQIHEMDLKMERLAGDQKAMNVSMSNIGTMMKGIERDINRLTDAHMKE